MTPPAARTTVDEVFGDLLAFLVDTSPTTATQLGNHRRDGDLDDWGPDEAERRMRTLSGLAARIDELDAGDDAEAAGDAVLVGDAVAALRFELEGLRAHATDPLHYLGLATGSVYDLIRRDDLPAAPRQQAAASRAAQVPRLLEQAATNLTELPAPHRELALVRLPGAAALFRDTLPGFAPDAAEAGEAAARACEAFGAVLSDRADDPAPDWRLGADRWADALRLALGVRMPAEEVWERANASLPVLQGEAEQLAAQVLDGRTDGLRGRELVAAGLAEVARDRSERDALVDDAAGVLGGIKEFLRADGAFELPDPDALRVEHVPDFLQGYAVAFFMPAPPLEPAAAHTYYLSPVPDAWDGEQAASFLREYNVHALRSVGIHEAYPGHYVQLAAAQRHPRLLRRALWNSAFAEGWAVYAEREVVAAGYDGGPPQQPDSDRRARLRLVSAKMEMRAVANALLDQGLHVAGWSDDQALELLVGTTYQERSEATGKLVRGKVSAGQLSTYFVGGEEMDDLRRDVEAARGGGFEARAFHRDVLAEGTPPFAVLRRALLAQPERQG